jgi:hypothetical protein
MLTFRSRSGQDWVRQREEINTLEHVNFLLSRINRLASAEILSHLTVSFSKITSVIKGVDREVWFLCFCSMHEVYWMGSLCGKKELALLITLAYWSRKRVLSSSGYRQRAFHIFLLCSSVDYFWWCLLDYWWCLLDTINYFVKNLYLKFSRSQISQVSIFLSQVNDFRAAELI